MLITILLILLVLSVFGGGWGYPRWGYASWSPIGLIVLILLIMWIAGYLHVGHMFH